MSELKELSWEVQETVEPPPFEALERRGVRRRRRRHTAAGAGVVAAVTIAVAAALLPLGNVTGTEKPPVAANTQPITVDKAAESIIGGARLAEVVFAGPNSWTASWDGSTGQKQAYTAVLSRDGVRTTAPVRQMWYAALRIGDDPVAVVGPSGGGEKNDPSWANALMVRLTAQGKVEKKLRWAAPTTTFGANEVLTFEVTHEHVPMILNPDDGTLRKLKVEGADYLDAPVQDSTGRWWLTGGKEDKPSYIFWTDDGGRKWNKTQVDPRDAVGGVGVSADGNTTVAYTLGLTTGGPVRLRISTDHGKTWTTTAPRERTWTRAPVALNDGNILLLENGKLVQLNGPAVATAPKGASELRGRDDVLWVMTPREGGEQSTAVAVSTDLGKTWRTFDPR